MKLTVTYFTIKETLWIMIHYNRILDFLKYTGGKLKCPKSVLRGIFPCDGIFI